MPPNIPEGPNATQAKNWHGRDGARWARHKAPHDAMLAPLTEKAFDAVGFVPGQRVLDLGCGSGTTTFEIARRIAPSGLVIGIDISKTLLALGREQAAAEPDLRIKFEFADIETHKFAVASFDVAFSRIGVMFFSNPATAFANVHRAMIPGSQLAFVCWRKVRANTWASVTLDIARRHVEMPPRPGLEDPGPYSFRDPERVHRILTEAGWSEIAIVELDADAYMGADLDEALANCLTVGPIANQVLAAPENTRTAIATELRSVLPEYVTKRGVIMHAATWFVTATA